MKVSEGRVRLSVARRGADSQPGNRNMLTKLPYLDGEPFIARMEEAIERGDADLVEANMPRVEALISRYQHHHRNG